jgi:transporter family-2 protein
MQSLVLVILLGILGGIAVGMQAPLASLMSQRLGLLESIFIVNLGGLLCAGFPLVFIRGGQLLALQRVPWYALAAGALGPVVIGAVSVAIPRVGASATIILIVAGQLVVGVLIDQFGFLDTLVRPLGLLRVAGLALVLLGAWLVIR